MSPETCQRCHVLPYTTLLITDQTSSPGSSLYLSLCVALCRSVLSLSLSLSLSLCLSVSLSCLCSSFSVSLSLCLCHSLSHLLCYIRLNASMRAFYGRHGVSVSNVSFCQCIECVCVCGWCLLSDSPILSLPLSLCLCLCLWLSLYQFGGSFSFSAPVQNVPGVGVGEWDGMIVR